MVVHQPNQKKINENLAQFAAKYAGDWHTPARDRASQHAVAANVDAGMIQLNDRGQFTATRECVRKYRTYDEAKAKGEL